LTYQHRDNEGNPIDLPVGKVVCVGQNYFAHMQEMQGREVAEPILFIKPATSLVPLAEPLLIPTDRGSVHHELELAVLIGSPLTQARPENVMTGVWGYGAALDLTLRDIQARLKAAGHPWERAKAFDGACPVSGFTPKGAVTDPQRLSLQLQVNGQQRQQGCTSQMMRTIHQLLAEISAVFTLEPGDIVLTGTPAGVGPLLPGDQLLITLDSLYHGALQVFGNGSEDRAGGQDG